VKYIRDDKLLKKFGEKLKSIRKEKKISQEKLAYAAGIEHSQVVRIEKAQINTSLSTVFAIAKGLNISPKELFDF